MFHYTFNANLKNEKVHPPKKQYTCSAEIKAETPGFCSVFLL